ncbi:Pentatricopeptide repeat-containing protein [Phytophthora citrophthora]|uniref:Pentatricopeptide repeat-containing protein n=1 Tax=Phytophthora citrophthora TaxID=4793 RepID=A0AAD9GVT8_9STRA|nr:Pentatricopeptide repeat-containing protein [Phytophthora citrophthora]
MLRRVCQRAVFWQSPQLSSAFSVAVEATRRPRASKPSRNVNLTPKIRFKDRQINVLLSPKSTSDSFVFACRALRCKDEVKLLAATDPRAWNVALKRRLDVRDERGAAELLGLVASFAVENASEPIWIDLLFTVLRQRSSRSFRAEEIQALLAQLKKRYGPQFVSRVLVEVINGCANINMLNAAQELLLYQQKLWPEIRENEWGLSSQEPLMPPSVVGHLMTKLTQKKKYTEVLKLSAEYFSHPDFDPARDFQQQGFLTLFQACTKTKSSPRKIVRIFLDYVDGSVHATRGDGEKLRSLMLERGFGAAIQCCATLEEFSLALHCYKTMESTRERLIGHENTDILSEETEEKVRVEDRVLPLDENMGVNVMKACKATNDFGALKEVFREIAARGVARSAGFGSAIRYCHEHLDPNFLEEVLSEVFKTELDLAGAWMLEVENYNDALGCFAATAKAEQAKELFSQMVSNPFIVPDHITMLEMVESHREASVEEIFDLMNAFLEWKLVPNLQVFTSLLSICMRRRVVGDAVALINAMEKHGVVPDVKAFTTIAFIHASHGDLKAIVAVIREMSTMGVASDKVFFDYVVNALYGSSGIDMCFSLFRELSQENLAIPEGLYVSLVDLGTQIGLIERTLHIAYNMECEGFQLSAEQLHELMVRCQSEAEISEFVRTFSLLHQGFQPETPRFDVEVYEDLITMLTQSNRKNEVAKVQKLAQAAGHDNLIV